MNEINFPDGMRGTIGGAWWRYEKSTGALGNSVFCRGDQCGFKDGGDCRFLAAKLDALRRTLSVVKREIKKLEAEAED